MPTTSPCDRWLVAGCNPRVTEVEPPDGVRTIGLNDHTSVTRCDELVVCDAPNTFTAQRRQALVEAEVERFWHRDVDPWERERLDDKRRPIKIVHATQWRGDYYDGVVPCYFTSLPAGIVLAVRGGARRIGVLACDMVMHPALGPYVGYINDMLRNMRRDLARLGIEIANVSPRGLSTRLQFERQDLPWLSSST